MRNCVAKIGIILTLVTLPFISMAANEVFLTLDPDAGPTVVSEPGNSAVVIVRSIDYSGGDKPEPFMLRFKEAEFKDAYSVPGGGENWTVPTVTASGIVFQSKAATWNPGAGNINVQVVRIKLKNGVVHPAMGYKYEVLMGTQVLDPRLRPR